MLPVLGKLKPNKEIWDLFTKKEEYFPKQLDKHSRFTYAYSNDKSVLEPRVSRFLIENGYRVKYPENKRFAVCLTHDVDNLYPPLTHSLASSLYSLKNLNFKQLNEQVLWKFSRRYPSPYNNFNQIIEMEKSFGAKSTFYFLATERDVLRLRYGVEELYNELKFIIDNGWEVGLHVGYYSFDDLPSIVTEKERLEKVLGREVVGCRNHYLRFKTPSTWEMLVKAGFKYDATFGYSDSIGFRNGMCHPFRPFNLDTDSEINIMEIPLTIMDGVLFGDNPAKALTKVKGMIDVVEKYNGVATLLWHNHIFNCPFRENWAKLYESILGYCREKNAWLTSAEEIYKWYCRAE